MKTVFFSSLCIPGCPTSLPVSSDRPRPKMYSLTYKCRSTFAVIWSKYYKDCAFVIFITVFFLPLGGISESYTWHQNSAQETYICLNSWINQLVWKRRLFEKLAFFFLLQVMWIRRRQWRVRKPLQTWTSNFLPARHDEAGSTACFICNCFFICLFCFFLASWWLRLPRLWKCNPNLT